VSTGETVMTRNWNTLSLVTSSFKNNLTRHVWTRAWIINYLWLTK
jgi:hypothetical protein